MNSKSLSEYSNYWETVRSYYYPFESGLKAGTGEVYSHEIPGGQYSNLKGQAIALGLEHQFPEITKMYAEVNDLFGDIIKVTPSSKVVGDMAQYLISNGYSIQDVLEKGDTISFPDSVIQFFRGDLGQPVGGFPSEVQKLVLKDEKAYTDRPNAHLEPIDFDKEFTAFKKKFKKGMGRELFITDYLSYKLYPKVFTNAYEKHVKYGNVMKIPTKNFFYGMEVGEEIMVELDRGKNVLISLMLKGEPNEDGNVSIFFKVNGQLRNVVFRDQSVKVDKEENIKIDPSDPKQIGAPLQGLLSNVLVKKGQEIIKNQPLFVIEAMKMETTVTATDEGVIDKVQLNSGALVNTDDLILKLK